jgi:hypothetical protein
MKASESPGIVLSEYRGYDGQVVDLKQLLCSPYDDISEAAEKIPAYIGYFGYQLACARARIFKIRNSLKIAEAKAYFGLKNGDFIANGYGDKYTETAISQAVVLDEKVQKAANLLAAAERDFIWISEILEALKAKLDLLRSVEVTRRLEAQQELKVKIP